MNLDALDRTVAGLREQTDSRVLLDLPRLMGLLRRPGELAELLDELDRRRERFEEQRLAEQAIALARLERLGSSGREWRQAVTRLRMCAPRSSTRARSFRSRQTNSAGSAKTSCRHSLRAWTSPRWTRSRKIGRSGVR